MEGCRPWQRLNHLPRTGSLTKKDALFRVIQRMRNAHGAVYDITPTTYIIPTDYARFARDHAAAARKGGATWIFKVGSMHFLRRRDLTRHLQPADLSRGRGIFLFRELADLMFDTLGVVQSYIPTPMTIDGYKLDLRVYVAVTSYNPLTVYVCREGLVRFGSERFNADDIANLHAHVTNTSLNKTRATGDCKVRHRRSTHGTNNSFPFAVVL